MKWEMRRREALEFRCRRLAPSFVMEGPCRASHLPLLLTKELMFE